MTNIIVQTRWTHLDGVLVTNKVNNFKSVSNNSDCHELLSVVTTVHHQARACIRNLSCTQTTVITPVDQSLNNGHLGLLELLLRVSSSGVGKVDGMADLDVICQRDIGDLNPISKPQLNQAQNPSR